MSGTEPALGRARPELTEPLVRVLEWLVSHRDATTGALICPKHRIEHTGKSAGAIVLAVELAKHARNIDRDRMFEIARGQCERLVARLEREPNSTCFTFRPGRHDPYNCSNSVIDGGACSDALATCVMAFGDRLSADERERFTHASVLHAQTYLRYAIVDKGIPAQCAWAMTGAAQAYRLSEHEVLRYVCEVGAERIAKWQRGDGSFPYHPLEQESGHGPGHPGASDASAYYQSRVNAFLSFALERSMGERGVALDRTFESGLEFLHGLVGPDGIKTAAIEAKPWYWGAEYEVASHPFDIAVFATEWRRTRAARAARMLRASWEAWRAHLSGDGAPTSHRVAGANDPARRDSYQCPVFWAAHASWIARSLPELEDAFDAASEGDPDMVPLRHFPDVDLARIESPSLVAWVRGRRPPGNASHGSRAGGLLRVFDRREGHDLWTAAPHDPRQSIGWFGASGLVSPRRGLRAGASELRFSGWLARSRWRAGERVGALGEPARALRSSVLDYVSTTVSPNFDRAAQLAIDGDVVSAAGELCFRDGTAVGGRAESTYRMRPDGTFEVELRCAEASAIRRRHVRVPDQIRAVVQAPKHRGDAFWVRFGSPVP